MVPDLLLMKVMGMELDLPLEKSGYKPEFCHLLLKSVSKCTAVLAVYH